jgi:hypothetical protein
MFSIFGIESVPASRAAL